MHVENVVFAKPWSLEVSTGCGTVPEFILNNMITDQINTLDYAVFHWPANLFIASRFS